MRLQFEDYVVDTERRELRRRGSLVSVQPQVFDLLVHLIRNRDRVVTKDDLLAAVWNGRIVSESTLISRINAARRAIGDDGEQQRLIRTVARRGVRFVGAVSERAPKESVASAATADDEQPLDEKAGHASHEAGNLKLPDRPSIAVMPFANLSGDLEQAYFADGIVDDIITALSRLR